jgi:uroporphyrinogen decarboxylase
MGIATQLMGMEETLFFASDHPEEFERVLDYAADVAIRFGIAQLHAGVHVPVVLDPAASPEVVSTAFFREFLLPRFQRILAAFQQAGAPRWLNIPGPIVPFFPYILEAGVDIVSFDYQVSAVDAQGQLPGICLAGNLKSLDFVLSPPDQIFRDASAMRNAFAGRGGFLLSSGCEIPPEANPENIDAMIAACVEP